MARGVPAAEIFTAVAEEIAQLFGDVLTAIGRFDADGPAMTFVGLKNVEGVEVGTRLDLHEGTPAGIVYATGRPARVDQINWPDVPLGELARRFGVVSTVASPIIVEDRLWGAVNVGSAEELPLETEERLENFTELVATAIANGEARTALRAPRRRAGGAAASRNAGGAKVEVRRSSSRQ